MAIDPGNLQRGQAALTLEPATPDTLTRAAATVRRVALDELDAAELLAMLGLDSEVDSQKCPNGHPCDNNGECRVDGCPYAKRQS